VDKTSPQNIQDAFLNTVRRERIVVSIQLMNGTTISGRVKSFDKFCVLFDTGSQELLIFKHAISTVGQTRRPSVETAKPVQAGYAPPKENPNPQS
jgi:host factor-I protein